MRLPVAAGAFVLLCASIAFAEPTDYDDRVVVPHWNLASADAEGAVPADIYTPEDLDWLGVRTQTALVQTLPQVSGTYLTENIANGGDGRTELNLRGLGPRESLVLVDGRRVAPTLSGSALGLHSVNLNFIPLPLIDSVELRKVGDGSRFGSEAVAGVLDARLKHRFRGFEMDSSYGNSNLGASNDAGEQDHYVLAGAGDDHTDIVVFADYYDRAAIFSRDRDISSNALYRRFGGIDLRSGNFAGRVQSFIFIPGTGSGPAGPNSPTPQAFPNAATDPDYQPRGHGPDALLNGQVPVPGQVDPFSNRYAYNFAELTSGIPAADRQYFYGSLIRDLCNKYLTLYADFKFVRTFFDGVLAPTPFILDPFTVRGGIPFSTAGISVPLQNPFNPFTSANATLPSGVGAGIPVTTGVFYRALEAGARHNKVTNNDTLFNVGIRGDLTELHNYFSTWGYEVNSRYDSVNTSTQFTNAVSKPGLREALLDTDPATAFNPFGLNVQTDAAKSRVFVDLHDATVSSLLLQDVRLHGDLLQLPAGSIAFAVTGSYRQETYRDTPDSLSVTFNTIGSTDVQASRGNRDIWSAFGELRIPVTSPDWNVPGAYSLELAASEGVESFSDVGTIAKPALSVLYHPFGSTFALRGSYTEVFHAPFVNELSPANQEGFPVVSDPRNPAQGAFQIQTLTGGNPDLKPELGYEWSYGAIWSPTFVKGLTFSADFYHIDLRDVITLVPNDYVFSNPQAFQDFFVHGPTGELLYINNRPLNLGRIITEGVDLAANYILDTSQFGRGDFGRLISSANASYLSRYEYAGTPGGKQFDQTASSFDRGALPQWKGYASVAYELGGFTGAASVRYVGQHDDVPTFTLGDRRKVSEWTTLNIFASYTFHVSQPEQAKQAGYGKDSKDKQSEPVSLATDGCDWRSWVNGTTIAVGINNVFDRDPPFVAGAFENGYDESSADVKGRFWYVSLKKRF